MDDYLQALTKNERAKVSRNEISVSDAISIAQNRSGAAKNHIYGTTWRTLAVDIASINPYIRSEAIRIAGKYANAITHKAHKLISDNPISEAPIIQQGTQAKIHKQHIEYDEYDCDGGEDNFFGDTGSVSYVRYLCNFKYIGEVASQLHISKELVDYLSTSRVPGKTKFRDLTIESATKMEEKKIDSHMATEVNFKHLAKARTEACGIGTRKLKIRLNNLFKKTGDSEVMAIRYLLEAEDANITAKATYFSYRDKVYQRKSDALKSACEIIENTGWKYGHIKDSEMTAMYLLYIYLPNGIQVSWHLNEDWVKRISKIECEWDRQLASTLPKILNYIEEKYPEILAS